ncbi:MAG TPA: hypothetical protein VIR56_06315 [Solimonas sp.]
MRHQQESSENTLKRALLQSMPGHSGYDPGTARRRLSAISYSKNTEDAALARIRLTEISNGSASDDCRSEVHDLQQRLDKIVDIERTLDRNGNAAKSDPAR